MRLIDADVLIEKYGDWYVEEGTEEGFIGTLRGLLVAQPTVEQKRGEQEAVKRTSRIGNYGFSIIWTCGACGSDLHPNNAKSKFCSNCGQAVKWDD